MAAKILYPTNRLRTKLHGHYTESDVSSRLVKSRRSLVRLNRRIVLFAVLKMCVRARVCVCLWIVCVRGYVYQFKTSVHNKLSGCVLC